MDVKGPTSNKLREIHWCVPPFPCSLTHCATFCHWSCNLSCAVRPGGETKPALACEAITSHGNTDSPSDGTQFLCDSHAISCSRDNFGVKGHCELYSSCLTTIKYKQSINLCVGCKLFLCGADSIFLLQQFLLGAQKIQGSWYSRFPPRWII